MAPLRYAAKFDPFLSLDCPPPWRNPRKGKEGIKFCHLATLVAGGGVMVYHNLWLPSRFGHLILYAAAVAVCLVLCCVGGIRSRRRYRRLSTKRRSSGPDPYSKLI